MTAPDLKPPPVTAGEGQDSPMEPAAGRAGTAAAGALILAAAGEPHDALALTRAHVMSIVVYGAPKPKGSLRHVGRGRMVEQLEGSKPWREAVKAAALERIRTYERADGTFLHRRPLTGPLIVEITSTVVKPKSAPKRKVTWPITRSSGDVDKHARNVLDALGDAGVYEDDSQVLDVLSRKRYPGTHRDSLDRPGAVIRIWRIGGKT